MLPYLAAADVLPLLSYAATFLLKRNTSCSCPKQACVSGKVMYTQEAGVALPSNICLFGQSMLPSLTLDGNCKKLCEINVTSKQQAHVLCSQL